LTLAIRCRPPRKSSMNVMYAPARAMAGAAGSYVMLPIHGSAKVIRPS
jgi:hypothetical protein